MDRLANVDFIPLTGLFILAFILINGATKGNIFLGVGLDFSKRTNPIGYWICMSSIFLFAFLLFVQMIS